MNAADLKGCDKINDRHVVVEKEIQHEAKHFWSKPEWKCTCH